jgi:hypothetical protein
VDETVVEDVHGRGLALNVWTENDPERMKELIGFGVDMIITDAPDVFAAVRDELCEEPICPPEVASEDDGGCAFGGAERRGALPSWLWLIGIAWLAGRRLVRS